MSESSTPTRHSVIAVDSLRRVPSYEPPPSDASRTDVSNPALFSKPFQAYSPSVKYTYYSTGTDVRQAWTLDALVQEGEDPSVLFSDEKTESFWIDVVAPNSEDLTKLATTFGVHPLSIEDIQMADSREKCEVFERYLFLCIQTCDQKFATLSNDSMRRPSPGGGVELSTPAILYILVFQNYIISVHHEPIPHIRRVMRRLYGLKTSHLVLSADWVMYSLLDDTVDEFLPQMQNLELEVDTIDELVLFLTHTEQSDMLRRIGRARKRVTHLQRLLKPKIEILKILTKRSPDYLKEHTLIYLRDVNDHVLTNIQNLEQYSETLNRSHSNYLAQISIELNEASNRMNIVMKKLTAAAALVLPLSLISGIWGMNVPVPGEQGVEGWVPLIPFCIIVVFMALMMAAMYYIGHRNDWW
jgi:magnesium transporter